MEDEKPQSGQQKRPEFAPERISPAGYVFLQQVQEEILSQILGLVRTVSSAA
jgi:hypothetical protein